MTTDESILEELRGLREDIKSLSKHVRTLVDNMEVKLT